MIKTDEELNIEIAKLLGFEIHYNVGGIPVQVTYPERFKDIIYSCPTDSIPNFTLLIDNAIELIKKYPIVPSQRVGKV